MGLFSFIKEAGKRLGIGGAEAAQPEGSPAADPPTPAELEAEVKKLGLEATPDPGGATEGPPADLTQGGPPSDVEIALVRAGAR